MVDSINTYANRRLEEIEANVGGFREQNWVLRQKTLAEIWREIQQLSVCDKILKEINEQSTLKTKLETKVRNMPEVKRYVRSIFA